MELTREEELLLAQTLLQMKQGGADDDMLEARRMEILSLPPEERAEAFRLIGQDYKGKRRNLESDVIRGEDLANTPMAEGGVAGPAGNPYAVYVADVAGNIGAGAERFMGNRMRKKARGDLDTLSNERGQGLQDIGASAVKQKAQSRLLRAEQWEEDKKKGYRPFNSWGR